VSTDVIWVAGVNVKREAIQELADRLGRAGHDDLAAELHAAADAEEQKEVALSIEERDTILVELKNPPEELEELRGMLRAEQERRRGTRHGIGKKGRRNR
jgi:hypothetical protein